MLSVTPDDGIHPAGPSRSSLKPAKNIVPHCPDTPYTAATHTAPAMPDNTTSADTKHDGTIAKVIKNEQDIDKKMSGQKALKALLEHGRLLLSLVKDYFTGAYREVPYWAIGAAALALVYVLSPVDAIPDVIPGLGYLDDATVLAFCLKLVETELEKYKEWRKIREVETQKA